MGLIIEEILFALPNIYTKPNEAEHGIARDINS